MTADTKTQSHRAFECVQCGRPLIEMQPDGGWPIRPRPPHCNEYAFPHLPPLVER